MQPTKRAVVIVLAGLPLALLPVLVWTNLWPVWMAMWAVFLVASGVDLVLLPKRKRLGVTFDIPETLYLGTDEPASAMVAIAGRKSPVQVWMKLDVSDNLAPLPPMVAGVAASPAEYRFALRAVRRGKTFVEQAWLRFVGPLGLVQRTLLFPVDKQSRAVPDAGLLRRFAIEHFSAQEYRSGLKMERYIGEGSELESLREYLPGMDHRRIHWKASARHTRLLCRQFRAERSHQIILALDTGRLMGETIDGLPRLDHAIHAAVLMTYLSARSGDRLGFYWFNEKPGAYFPPHAGMKAAKSILKLAGDLEYSTAETNYTWSLATLMGHLKRRSLVVVFTDFVDTATAELMVENLHRMANRHLVLFVALRDPLLVDAVSSPPADFHTMNRTLVADTLLQEREIVIKKLKRKGVFCIDAKPEEVSLQLISRYLEVKRREMI